MRLRLLWVVTTTVLLSSVAAVPADAGRVVRILFTNNSNGKLEDCNCPTDPYGGLGERVALIREYREYYSEFLLLDSGGYLGLSNVGRTGPVVFKLMDIMGYNARGIGDQELYFGLGSYLNRFGEWKDGTINASLRTKAGETAFTPYRITTVDSIRVGIIGLVSEDTFRFFPKESKDFTVEHPDSTLARLLPVMKGACDYCIVLSQMGRVKDEEFALRWPGIDLIIGGHSQTLLEKAIRVSDCRIVQAGKNGGHVGEVVLTFDPDKKLRNFSYKIFEVSDRYSIPSDIQSLVDEGTNTAKK